MLLFHSLILFVTSNFSRHPLTKVCKYGQGKTHRSVQGLFYYGKKESLKESYFNSTNISGTYHNPKTNDWDQENFTFNRLFIGPITPLPPAVASVYLGPEGQIQGRVPSKVREFFTNYIPAST